ncbi:MAG: DUF819 family protein [Bacteroidales bacterium]|nr:DUF819 family protein [Bacteroidales bacterium]MBQ1696238.1 DUF819 family protein [Bacteroidales bacterium]MBQ2076341.1 DUF819 family protein [Bacteroidales bacterium]MBQ4009095.1 DUF819 family protein [Bacteroidales bacterium]MBQ5423914.1 DUF819 family protein [Bacteroidales bacterium]
MRIIIAIAIYLLFPIIIVSAFHKWKILQKIGTVILAYAVGIIMSLTGFVTFEPGTADAATFESIQKLIMNISVPLAIPLMLFNCDFKLWTRALPKTILALVGGIIAITVAVISGFFIFRNTGVNDITNVSAMMTGIYTGGTMNFNALGAALGVDPTTITLVLTFQMLITFPLIMFITGGGYRLFRKILPFPDESTSISKLGSNIEDHGIENYGMMLNKKVFPKTMLGLLLSIGFLAVGAGLSLLFYNLGIVGDQETGTGKLNELVIILTITTLSIIASFSKKIRELPKTFELGMIFILIFSIAVASQFNPYSIDMSAISLGLFVLYIMLVSVIIHIIFCRFSKINGDLYTVAQVGLFCSPPFIPPVVGAMGNKKVLISGIVIGLIGYAIGTYMGVGIAYLLKLF